MLAGMDIERLKGLTDPFVDSECLGLAIPQQRLPESSSCTCPDSEPSLPVHEGLDGKRLNRKVPRSRPKFEGHGLICTGGLSAMVESLGDYYAAAAISGAPVPPPDVLARGVTWQGISCILTGMYLSFCCPIASIPSFSQEALAIRMLDKIAWP